jgi:hypothetical protein
MKALRTFAAKLANAKILSRNLGFAAVAVAAGVAFSAPSAQAAWLNFGNPFGRPVDQGGNVISYIQRISAASQEGHAISGDCMSACTMWLGHRGTCVEADAVLYFHGASGGLGVGWGHVNPLANALLLGMYPPRVRAVVRPWLYTTEFHTLSGRQLASLGVPLCHGNAA